MANYKFVDTDQLEADLTAVADSIRTKGETTGALAFPAGFQEAVANISTGIEVQIKTGTFTTRSGEATINCGFKPDVLFATQNSVYEGYVNSACFAFTAAGTDNVCTGSWNSAGNVISCYGKRTNTGANITVEEYDDSWNVGSYNSNFSYVAVKYT